MGTSILSRENGLEALCVALRIEDRENRPRRDTISICQETLFIL